MQEELSLENRQKSCYFFFILLINVSCVSNAPSVALQRSRNYRHPRPTGKSKRGRRTRERERVCAFVCEWGSV